MRKPSRGRRGQTVILALAILFLLTLLGSIFVTMVVRNVRQVTRSEDTEDALTLALAGLRYAAEQFRTSEEGADWRPRPTEGMWREPNPTNPAQDPYAAQRPLDPDFNWLDSQRNPLPYVRYRSSGGRFLLRVRYAPQFRAAAANSTTADEFDPNSGLIHIESVGRPGEIDPNDPTTFRDPAKESEAGISRKVEAFVPIGLVDQLWWITNRTNERGPAHLGSPPFERADATGETLEYPSLFQGSIRSNIDVQFHGRNVIRIYPARGENVFVKGKLLLSPRLGVGAGAQFEIQAVDDNGDPVTTGGTPARPIIPQDDQDDPVTNDSLVAQLQINQPQGGTPTYTPLHLRNRGLDDRYFLLDDQRARSSNAATANAFAAQSTRLQSVPDLQQKDPLTGINRWLRLTRDSGGELRLQNPAPDLNRTVNAGWFGLTDMTLPEDVRARGLYLDNYSDIQYPTDRARVKEEWLRLEQSEIGRNGWLGDYYVPSVQEGSVWHPIAEAQFIRALRDPSQQQSATNPIVPKIRITRYDTDVRQQNLAPATGRQRQFYTVSGGTFGQPTSQVTLQAAGTTRDFEFPQNGVFYCEGSIRVRGTVGQYSGGGGAQMPDRPANLTIVSGGTIYVEGNLLKGHPGTTIGLLAQDYVTLNPTIFTRVQPGDDVRVVRYSPTGSFEDPAAQDTRNVFFEIAPGADLDFSVSAGWGRDSQWATLVPNPLTGIMHVKHSGDPALGTDITAETAVTLFRPRSGATTPTPWPNWTSDRYDFLTNAPNLNAGQPPFPPPANQPTQGYYLFRSIAAGAPYNWAESNFFGTTWERKSFWLPNEIPSLPGQEALFRVSVGYRDDTNPNPPAGTVPSPYMAPNAQPFWLSRVAVLPSDRPLPVRVEAVIYAFNGSWFVIPPPFFNDDPQDTRAAYRQSGSRPNSVTPGNLPAVTPQGILTGTEDAARAYPFYNEPLNYDIQVIGSITENMPALPSEVAEWTRHLWIGNLGGAPQGGVTPDNDPTVFPPENPDDATTWAARARGLYSPRLSYRYDPMFRRLVRVRYTRPWAPNFTREEVAWAAPLPTGQTAPPAGIPQLSTLIGAAKANRSYVEILPLLPRLPAGKVTYEGNPL